MPVTLCRVKKCYIIWKHGKQDRRYLSPWWSYQKTARYELRSISNVSCDILEILPAPTLIEMNVDNRPKQLDSHIRFEHNHTTKGNSLASMKLPSIRLSTFISSPGGLDWFLLRGIKTHGTFVGLCRLKSFLRSQSPCRHHLPTQTFLFGPGLQYVLDKIGIRWNGNFWSFPAAIFSG